MSPNAAKAAHRGDGGDLRKLTSGQEDVSEHIDGTARPQDRLVAVADKNRRSRFEARITSFDALRRVTLGIREQNGTGSYRENGPTLVFGPEHIDSLIELLTTARSAAIAEGLL